MADDPLLLHLGADHEPRHIGQEDQRDVERVAQLHKTGGLVRGVDEQRPALRHGVVRHQSDDLTVHAGEADDEFGGPQRVDLEEGIGVDQAADVPGHVKSLPLGRRDQRSQIHALRFFGRLRRRPLPPVRWQIGQVLAHADQGIGLALDQHVPHPGLCTMHPRATHLLQRGLLTGDHLHHPVAGQIHAGVALDHDHDVAEGRDVGTTGG